MMEAIIIDDEQYNIVNLRSLLQKYCPEVKVIATAQNAIDGKEAIQRKNPQLIFLDIQMPGQNGFDLLRSLQDFSFELIFVTAFDQYGIQAVKFAAIDYLLKPVSISELCEAVARASKKIKEKQQNMHLENLLHVLQHQANTEIHRIALPALKETRFILPKDILYCEASNNYTSFTLQSGEKLVISKPIYEYEPLLQQYGFIRCHQSWLVNKRHVISLVKEDGISLLITNGMKVPVSRNKKEVVKHGLQMP